LVTAPVRDLLVVELEPRGRGKKAQPASLGKARSLNQISSLSQAERA